MKAQELIDYINGQIAEGNIDPEQNIQFEIYSIAAGLSFADEKVRDDLPAEIVVDNVDLGYIGGKNASNNDDPLSQSALIVLGVDMIGSKCSFCEQVKFQKNRK